MQLSLDTQTAVLTLEHPPVNALGRAEIAQLASTITRLHDACEQGLRTLITTSRRVSPKGTPIFCAGANQRERDQWSKAEILAHVEGQRAVLTQLRTLPLFHLTVVDGAAIGLGTEIVLASDYCVATERSFFALPEISMGLIPGAGGTAHLAQRIGHTNAMAFACTGRRVTAAEALTWGLIQSAQATYQEASFHAYALCQRLSGADLVALRAFKAALLAGAAAPPSERLRLEAEAYATCLKVPSTAPPPREG